MSDLPADLPRLHVLRTWHAMWLTRIDEAIAAAEQREAEVRRGAEVRPDPPAYLFHPATAPGRPAAVPAAAGPVAGSRVRPLDAEQARPALVDAEGARCAAGHGPRGAVGQRAFLQRG
ncbi:DUF6233 domain-containing protein [Streptomyces albidoflavus]